VPQIRVAKAFRRHVDCPDRDVAGTTVHDAFEEYFSAHPAVRSYVLDEHGAVRQHVTVFVDDTQIADRVGQTDPVAAGDVIYVFQALSGG
jgi:molybdopterin synthase sulfur carrier subunit